VVGKVVVKEGATEWNETLAAGLVSGPPRLLEYRVQLLNASGRTAGASGAAFVASGAPPQAVEGFHGAAVKGGAMLQWKPVTSAAASSDVVELTRTVVTPPVPEHGAPKEPAESRFRPGAAPDAGDPGGTIDRTAHIGGSYRYSAKRIRTAEVGGQKLEVESVTSGSVTVAMLDVFPPNAPGGLVASPGFAGDASSGQRPAIDLSWEPAIEPRIAGYRVYRRDADNGAWIKLNTALVPVPAYQDGTVEATRRYTYRVTAVDETGNESAPSREVVEAAPGQ
jgi:hypothetical protein